MSFWEDLKEAAIREYAVGQDENRFAMMDAYVEKGQSPEGPRWRQMRGAYRTPQAINAALGRKEDPQFAEARKKHNIDFDVSTSGKKIGTTLGAIGADLTQDSLRRFYWLLNAAQATGDIIAESAIAQARPDLYALDKVPTGKYTKSGKPILKNQRRYGPGLVQLTAVPAGIAINTGLGLMTPFGGAEGYKAALPSDEDPSKTSNVIGEVAAKYIMGRTGNLLPYDEFVKVRPDVSPEEYARYKAFKFDKEADLNPFDDGQMGVPMGALKYTSEGIHGPEVQFLGRSLPVTTGITPFASAVAGAALGAKYGGSKPVRRGFYGGMGGLAAGQVVGNIIENERRRRNTVENELDGTLR